jgi:fucose 4-O-acetylase-like acetyltransferase
MVTGGLLLRKVPFTLPGYENFYTTSPLYMMIRIGCVLLITALLYRLEISRGWVPKPIQLAGQESLLVYGVHLAIIYGFLRGKRLAPVFGLQSGYLGGFLLSAGIVLLMLLLAKYWHALKKNYPVYTKIGQAITIVVMILVFLRG